MLSVRRANHSPIGVLPDVCLECDLDALTLWRRPWPTRDCRAKEKKRSVRVEAVC